MQTYLFYDIETTGLNKAFDQVLQFAAIRTDLNLNEIERYELKIKLNPDIIPTPRALITHHIGVNESFEGGFSEIDAIKQIHRWMNEPGTISLGYNTLEFDDEFLRFSFYRNLLPPYTHQYANKCSRMDIFPFSVIYFLFKNNIIFWPEKSGKVSLKLEEINNINQFVSGRAHHAMVDVEVTLELAQRFIKERNMWDYLIGYYNKQIDQERSRYSKGTKALMAYSKFGSEQKFLAPVLYLGNHNHYKNQTLWLRLDLENLTTTTPETISETTWVIRKKIGEPGFVLPNKDRYWEQLKPELFERSEANKQWLENNPELLTQIVNYHAEYKYPDYPDTDIEASLYKNGFWTEAETAFCRHFHEVNPNEKARMTEQLKDSPFKILATRIIGRHYPEEMTPKQANYFAEYMQHIHPQNEAQAMIDYRGTKRLSPTAALEEISKLRQEGTLSEQQIMLLAELEDYLVKKFIAS